MTRYKFEGYTITNCGYHQPDHCVWWEAVDSNGEACFHGHSLREVEFMILDDKWEQKVREINEKKCVCADCGKVITVAELSNMRCEKCAGASKVKTDLTSTD